MSNYNPVEDGWRNAKHPAFVNVVNDHFCEETLNIELSFDEGEDNERPLARIPLLYGNGHIIVEWNDGVKTEHKATDKDQQEAFKFLGRLFPEWAKFCADTSHTTQEKLYWFEEFSSVVLNTTMDYKVKHSASGFPNAYIKDPAKSKPKKERTTKSSTLSRGASAFAKVFGGTTAIDTVVPAPATPSKEVQDSIGAPVDESDIPF